MFSTFSNCICNSTDQFKSHFLFCQTSSVIFGDKNGEYTHAMEILYWWISLQACTALTLDTSETQRVIDNFTNQFYHLFMEYELSMTLKVHIIIHHYQYFFTKSGQTMKLTNGEFVETCHSSLRQSEERHGLKVKKKLGTPMHMQKIWQSLVLYNSKRAGHITPLRL